MKFCAFCCVIYVSPWMLGANVFRIASFCQIAFCGVNSGYFKNLFLNLSWHIFIYWSILYVLKFPYLCLLLEVNDLWLITLVLSLIARISTCEVFDLLNDNPTSLNFKKISKQTVVSRTAQENRVHANRVSVLTGTTNSWFSRICLWCLIRMAPNLQWGCPPLRKGYISNMKKISLSIPKICASKL